MNWYALYVKSRHEFVVSDELHRKGVETFLPSVTKFNQWKDRKKQVETPLFPGYLFVYFEPNPVKFMNVIKKSQTSMHKGHALFMMQKHADWLNQSAI